MSASPGSTVRLQTDWQGPIDDPTDEGVYVVSETRSGYGATYLILEARHMTRSAKRNRYALRCLKLAGPQEIPDDARCIVFHWHRRNRRQPR